MNKTFLAVILVVPFILLGTLWFWTTIEMAKKPTVAASWQQNDLAGVLEFYIDSDPTLENRAILGDSNAPITIVAYVNPSATTTSVFSQRIFPQLYQDYIQTGKAKLVAKVPISIDDYEQKTQTYAYARQINCAQNMSVENYLALLSELQTFTSPGPFCEQLLLQDVSETEHLGLSSVNARFYIQMPGATTQIITGIPDYGEFTDTLRQFELVLGI